MLLSPLSLAISRDVRCGCDFYVFPPPPHSPCVAHFYHLLWVSCHSAALPLHSFSWAFNSHLKLLVHSRTTCCIIKTEKVGRSSKNRTEGGARGGMYRLSVLERM